MRRLIILLLFPVLCWGGYRFVATSSQYVNIDALVGDVASDTQGSFGGWIDFQNGGADQAILGFGDANAESRIMLFLTLTNNLTCAVENSATNEWILGADDVLTSGLHLVYIVQNGTEAVLYIDTMAVAQTFIVFNDKTVWINNIGGIDNARIGCREFNSGGNTLFMNNELEDVRYYNRALALWEIQEIYYSHDPDYLSSKADSCKGQWRMDEVYTGVAATTTIDYSGMGNTGTPVNSLTGAPSATRHRRHR